VIPLGLENSGNTVILAPGQIKLIPLEIYRDIKSELTYENTEKKDGLKRRTLRCELSESEIALSVV
jgi:hypothetical protein